MNARRPFTPVPAACRLRGAGARHQRGQAAVMTYLFAVVLVLAALSLFRTGRLTADKMELQNAADSLAYSVSTVEARDLNFAAYTNRAIVANEVAIGQAIGMASWAAHWKSIGDFLLEYNKYLSGPTLGISNAILPPLASAFQVSGGVFMTLMRGYAKAMTAVNHNVNKAYGIAQQIFHLSSVVNTLGLLDESIKANAPDGAHMSGYGVLMLIGHLATYGGLPVPVTEKFTQSYNPASPPIPKDEWQADTAGATDAGGYGRLAATIHNSGDPFTKGWHNPPDHLDADLTGRGWIINFFEMMADAGMLPRPQRLSFSAGPVSGFGEFGVYPGGWLGFEIGGGVDFGIVGADVNFFLQVRFRMLREGGSEIRVTIPIAGANRDKVAGDLFSWSSADTANFDLGFRGGGGFSVGKVDLLSANVVMQVADERMFIGFGFGGSGEGCSDPTLDDDPDNDDDDPECESVEDSADVVIYDGSFPTSAPLGAAATWTGKTAGATPNAITSAPQHMATELDFAGVETGPLPVESYGHAAERIIAWYYPPSLPASGIMWQPSNPAFAANNVGSSYKGLPRYLDTTGAEPLFKSGGPMLVVGLTLDEDDFEEEHYDRHSGKKPVGRFGLDEAFGWDSMAAIAKSEVYFDRPLDLSYFARGDGYVEHGSAFNPYWEGRLIETSHADRVLALLLQNGEVAQEIDVDPNVEALWNWLAGALGI
jgi:hypothetical protein